MPNRLYLTERDPECDGVEMESLVSTFRLGSYTNPEAESLVTVKVKVPEFLVFLDVKVTLPVASVRSDELPPVTSPLHWPRTVTPGRTAPLASLTVIVALAEICRPPPDTRDMLMSETKITSSGFC